MPDLRPKPTEILRAPYSRVVIPDLEKRNPSRRGYSNFPGCVAQGDSVPEAYERLESAAEAWLEAASGFSARRSLDRWRNRSAVAVCW